MVAMMFARVPTADSEGLLLYFGVANGDSSAITGASMKSAIKKPIKNRFICGPLAITLKQQSIGRSEIQCADKRGSGSNGDIGRPAADIQQTW